MQRALTVVLASSDLMLIALIDGSVRARGGILQSINSADQLADLCRQHAPRLLILDLRLPALDVAALLDGLRDQLVELPYIVACGPHVRAARLQAARDAGCDEVLTRGQIDREINSLLDRITAVNQ